MQKAIGFLAMIVIGLCLPSCSSVSSYNIKVNGYTDPGTPAQVKPGGSFFVMENKEAKNPLLEAEVKGKITKLLATRGYAVTTFEKADYYLFFGYGLGEPRSVTVAAPDYYGSIGWGMGYGWGGLARPRTPGNANVPLPAPALEFVGRRSLAQGESFGKLEGVARERSNGYDRVVEFRGVCRKRIEKHSVGGRMRIRTEEAGGWRQGVLTNRQAVGRSGRRSPGLSPCRRRARSCPGRFRPRPSHLSRPARRR